MRKPCVFKSTWEPNGPPRIVWMEKTERTVDDGEVPFVVIYPSQNSFNAIDTVPMDLLDMAPLAMAQ